MNPNSIAAWHKFQEDGKLTPARKKAYYGLCVHGPCTAQELTKALCHEGIHKRLSELAEQRFIIREGSRECTVTGHKSTVWMVDPDAEPIEYIKPKKDKLTLTQRVQELEIRVAALEAEEDDLPF